jgi:hypothetical protein
MVMEFDWLTIIIALGLAFAAWKIIKGLAKFAVIAAILGGGFYAYSQGVFS